MSNAKAILLASLLMGMGQTGMYMDDNGRYYPAPSTDGQKLLFNQPKKLSKKQKAKLKKKS